MFWDIYNYIYIYIYLVLDSTEILSWTQGMCKGSRSCLYNPPSSLHLAELVLLLIAARQRSCSSEDWGAMLCATAAAATDETVS